MRHERQTLIPWWSQEQVRAASVLVAGCGALGSQVAVGAARLGVGRVLLVDPDVLEEHNLENQIYDTNDIGMPKVDALAERLRAIDGEIRVETATCRLQDFRRELPEYAFGCFDNVAARYFLNFTAVARRAALIDGGIAELRGSVTSVVPRKTACLACFPFLPHQPKRASCSSNPVPSTYVTAAIVANLQLAQFVKLVHGLPVRSHLAIDLARSTLHANDFAPNPECEICGGV